jgi:hypothetical protein
MSGSIELDPKAGVNPRLTFCPRCGGDSNELVLLGARKFKRICSCGCVNFGARGGDKCGKCGEGLSHARREEIKEHDRLPALGLCETCKEDEAMLKEVVTQGGIYWKCKDCHASGAIKGEHPIAQMVRWKMKIETPKPCGIEFSKVDCPNCGPNGKEKVDAADAN